MISGILLSQKGQLFQRSQDVVIGLTMVFSNTTDVGDLVEVTGSTTVIGRVEEIGLRFTRLINSVGE